MAKENFGKIDCKDENDRDKAINSLEEDLNLYYKLYERYKSPIQFPCLAKLYHGNVIISYGSN